MHPLSAKNQSTHAAPATVKYVSQFALFCYRSAVRVKSKLFSLAISGAFANFGIKTVLMTPLRLSGEHRIAIGEGVFVGPGSWLQTLPSETPPSIAISIGDGTSIAGNCVISAAQSVVLKENVLVARNVYISDHIHKYNDTEKPILDQGLEKVSPVLIESGAWLGQNVVVCPGVTIGRGAVIGANSVVILDVPEFSLAVGSPARVVKSWSRSPVPIKERRATP